MSRCVWLFLIALLFHLSPAVSHDGNKPTVVTIDSLTEVERHVANLAAKYGPGRTLVVFDIDNTVLTMSQDLGSDAWFNWQRGLLKAEPPSEFAVARDFAELLAAQYLLYRLSDMKPTEDRTQALIQTLQDRGHPVMALTARGPDIRSATLRELNDFNIHFHTAPRCGPPLCGRRGIIGRSQIGWAAEQTKFAFSNVGEWLAEKGSNIRPIGYGNGVMMVAGQNKGVMLQLLLTSSDASRYRAVVFLDDGKKNIENVESAFDHPMLEVVALHYTRFKENVDSLPDDEARKNKANADWKAVRKLACEVFRRFCVAQ